MNLEFNATPEEVMRAVEAVQEFGRKKGFGEREIFALALAVEECGSNIVNHAYQGQPGQKFRVSVEHNGSTVCIELRDHGPEFDPTQKHSSETALDEDARPPGGWGVQLVRRYIDKIGYRRENGENVLRLTKTIPPKSG